MELGLSGKTALVTGAGRGIGAAIAKTLADEGVRIVALSKSPISLSRLMQSLNGVEIHKSLAIDLTKLDAPTSVSDWLERENLSINILIHALGGVVGSRDPLVSWDEYEAQLLLNLGFSVELNRLLIPKMQQSNWGRICHISSISAIENHGPPTYCAAKAALNAYVKSLGRYLANTNVVMTAVLPGAINTEEGYWEKLNRMSGNIVEKYAQERIPVGRFGNPEEISNMVAFLVSEHSSFASGSLVIVDGGQSRTFDPPR